MLGQGKIFNLEEARDARNKLKELSYFLTCPINIDSARKFIKTLVDNNMLYYFEEEAENVTNEEGEYLFTYKQAVLLNIIRNKFRETPNVYNLLFDEVETNFRAYCIA